MWPFPQRKQMVQQNLGVREAVHRWCDSRASPEDGLPVRYGERGTDRGVASCQGTLPDPTVPPISFGKLHWISSHLHLFAREHPPAAGALCGRTDRSWTAPHPPPRSSPQPATNRSWCANPTVPSAFRRDRSGPKASGDRSSRWSLRWLRTILIVFPDQPQFLFSFCSPGSLPNELLALTVSLRGLGEEPNLRHFRTSGHHVQRHFGDTPSQEMTQLEPLSCESGNRRSRDTEAYAESQTEERMFYPLDSRLRVLDMSILNI